MEDLIRVIGEILRRLDQLEALSRLTYVKNTWTPTYLGSATAGTTTYTTQQGYYIRVGLLVVATFDVVWTAATGTGQVRLGGLPYAAAATYAYSFQPRTSNVTFANGSIDGLLQATTTAIRLFSPATNAAGTELNIEAAGTITGTIAYFTS